MNDPKKTISSRIQEMLKGTDQVRKYIDDIDRVKLEFSAIDRISQELQKSTEMDRIQKDIEDYFKSNKFFDASKVVDLSSNSATAAINNYLDDMRAFDLEQKKALQQLTVPQFPTVDFSQVELLKLSSVDLALKNSGAHGAITKFLEQEKKMQFDLQQIAKNISSPWARTSNILQSAKSLVEVRSMGLALNSTNPYDESLTDALRIDLGDWREPVKFEAIDVLETESRIGLYIDQGFDRSLTDFPEPVYAETLENSGLTEENYFLNVYDFLPPPTSTEEHARLKRGTICYNILLRLEIALRSFIDEKMSDSYGEDWCKIRMREMHDEWKRKAAIAESNGRPVARLIDMSDFTDYQKIITKRDNFKAVFKPFFKRPESADETFQRLYPIRLATAHARPPSQEDIIFLTAESVRLFRIMTPR